MCAGVTTAGTDSENTMPQSEQQQTRTTPSRCRCACVTLDTVLPYACALITPCCTHTSPKLPHPTAQTLTISGSLSARRMNLQHKNNNVVCEPLCQHDQQEKLAQQHVQILQRLHASLPPSIDCALERAPFRKFHHHPCTRQPQAGQGARGGQTTCQLMPC